MGDWAWYICTYDWGKISKQQTRERERGERERGGGKGGERERGEREGERGERRYVYT